MAVRITLDKAPVPGEAVKLALLSIPICAAGAVAFLMLAMIVWAVFALLYPPWAPQTVFRSHGIESWPLIRIALLLGAGLGVVVGVQALVQGRRWRASHNRRSMAAMAAALRRHRHGEAGWLIHRQRRGLLVLAAALAYFPALFALGRVFGPFRLTGAAVPLAVVAVMAGFFLLLALGVRLLTTDVPLRRSLGTTLTRWLLRLGPFVVTMLVFVFLTAWLLTRSHDPAQRGPGGFVVLGMLVAALLSFWVGGRLERRFDARLFAASLPGASEARAGDRRPPILYLRSFGDDRAAVRSLGNEAKWTRIEDVLADAARPYGPVIGIGRPDGPPDTGFARAYFEGESWRDAVEKWVDEAQFVLLVAGYTSGVSWELEQVLAQGHAAKLIVVFPPGEDRFAPRWDWLQERARRFRVAFLPEKPVAGALLVCLDRHGEELVMTARKPTARHYRSALAIALVERFRL